MKSMCDKNVQSFYNCSVFYRRNWTFSINKYHQKAIPFDRCDPMMWFINCAIIYCNMFIEYISTSNRVESPYRMKMLPPMLLCLFDFDISISSGLFVETLKFSPDLRTVYIKFMRTWMRFGPITRSTNKQTKWCIYCLKYFWFWFMIANKSCIYVFLPT